MYVLCGNTLSLTTNLIIFANTYGSYSLCIKIAPPPPPHTHTHTHTHSNSLSIKMDILCFKISGRYGVRLFLLCMYKCMCMYAYFLLHAHTRVLVAPIG